MTVADKRRLWFHPLLLQGIERYESACSEVLYWNRFITDFKTMENQNSNTGDM